jgi:hypothetical protein
MKTLEIKPHLIPDSLPGYKHLILSLPLSGHFGAVQVFRTRIMRPLKNNCVHTLKYLFSVALYL